MKNELKKHLRSIIHGLGYEVRRYRDTLLDASAEDQDIARAVTPNTLTTAHAVHALLNAVTHVVERNIPGSLVECGVGRGGSMMAVALKLIALGQGDRDLYLFDTFAGMSEPEDRDISFQGNAAVDRFHRDQIDAQTTDWCYTPLGDVQAAIYSTGYDRSKLHFVKGKVEDTIPDTLPDSIALLRLDTDWYQSTRHELEHLYPRLAPGGILIIDDYGYWQGARQAVDEYIAENGLKILLHKIDHSCRIAVKV